MPLDSTVPVAAGPQLAAAFVGHFLWIGAVGWMLAEAARSAAHRAGPEFRSLLAMLSLATMVAAAGVAALAAAGRSAPLADVARTVPAAQPATYTSGLLVLAAWCVGSLALAAYVTCGIVRIGRLRKSAVRPPHAAVCDSVVRSRRLLGIPRPVTTALCDQLQLPILVGTRQPALLLPEASGQWTDSHVELVVVHELAHVRRCDNLVMFGQRAAECALWFHPGVWRISRWIDEEREFCCDDLVLAVTDRREEYARLLIGLLAGAGAPALPASALRGSSVPRRVRRILFPEEASMSRPVPWQALLVGGCCVLFGLIAIGSPPEPSAETAPLVAERQTDAPAAAEPVDAAPPVLASAEPAPPLILPATVVPPPFRGKTGAEPPPPGVVQSQRAWGPEQATGRPDTPGSGDQSTAWASRTEDDMPEWLLCEFDAPRTVKSIVVHETYNPGALVKLTAFDPDGQEVVGWEGEDPTPRSDQRGVSVFPVRFAFPVQRVKLYIDSPAVSGWNEIDAVAVVDDQGQEFWTVRAESSSTYAEPDVPAPATTKRDWGPEQAIGEPDTFAAGDQVTAWASQSQDDAAEWLLCEYAEPALPAEIVVHETYNPGAVHKLTAVDADGNETLLWEGLDPTPRDQPRGVSVFPVEPAAPIQKLKVYIDSQAVAGWNEIDAVGLRDLDGGTQWASAVDASSTFAEPNAAAVREFDNPPAATVTTTPTEETPDSAELLRMIQELQTQVAELQKLRQAVEALQPAAEPPTEN